ncbi:hypothetical protein GS424_011675 [Eggerthella guodeyinii]|uniref:Uncharacterized protein n=1 Tax=Eggerthella guodeyinii TaxID=2690837 RepID=A0A6L7IXZ7_9ACTN|nr:hypothetical protein [Eggerthella guodeyinii]QOS67188.1 hypothetical protein GS424_011675 [Eggerthella guodeyinii]
MAINKHYPWLLDSWSGKMYDTISVSSNEAYAYLRHSVGDRPLENLNDETQQSLSYGGDVHSIAL